MKRPQGILESDLLAEISRLQFRPSDPGLTVAEIITQTGRPRLAVLKGLKLAQEQGRLIVGRRMITRIDGKPSPVPVYRVSPEGSGPTAGRARRANRDTPQGGSNGPDR